MSPTPANPKNVEFALAEDGEHVEMTHDCIRTRALAILPLGSNGWTVQQRTPLTVKPSILCHTCQLHGWITNGQWWNA